VVKTFDIRLANNSGFFRGKAINTSLEKPRVSFTDFFSNKSREISGCVSALETRVRGRGLGGRDQQTLFGGVIGSRRTRSGNLIHSHFFGGVSATGGEEGNPCQGGENRKGFQEDLVPYRY